jgi:hypothetical protein
MPGEPPRRSWTRPWPPHLKGERTQTDIHVESKVCGTFLTCDLIVESGGHSFGPFAVLEDRCGA